MRGDQRLVSIGQVDMQGWVCTWQGGMQLGMGQKELGTGQKGPSIYTSFPDLPRLVQNPEEPKNSKLEPTHPGHVEGVNVELGRKNLLHLQVINQAVKLLHTQTSLVALQFVLLPYKC